MAAQNVLFALPGIMRISEFCAQLLVSIPGITACRVCLGGQSAQAGEMVSSVCADCKALRHLAGEDDPLLPTTLDFRCNLADPPGIRVIPIESFQHRFGFFVLKVDQADRGEPYQPFISNLANNVALILENHGQKNLLQKAHDDLERKVIERTQELTAANQALTASRLAALDSMKAAVQAQQRAEQASTILQREIAEHKQAEADLRESEERFKALFNKAAIPLCIINKEKGTLIFNAQFQQVFGYSPEEIPTMNEWWQLAYPDPVYRQWVLTACEAELQRAIEEKTSLRPIEYRVTCKNGNNLAMVVSGSAIGENFLLTFFDVTERKQAEEEIQKLNLELEKRVIARTSQLKAANRELESFAYSVSHDLRAPLRHIDGFLELLEKKSGKWLDEISRHYMDNISGAAQKMSLLIDDLLSFSRMGRQAMSPKKVDLGNLVRDIIRELAPDAVGRNIDWCIGDLPGVNGDAAMLRIVLVNLISNAFKFTRPREKARIEIGSLPGQNTETVIFVRDNGVGFDMTYKDKLFGVFQRLHRADEFEGTGIGLANVRRLIARHGGRTWAESALDQGATFYVALPQTPQGVEMNHANNDPHTAPGR